MINEFDQRPWGNFTVLDEGDEFKVKRIEVLPNKRLSYQKHARRTEHWFVVRGTAKVTLNHLTILTTPLMSYWLTNVFRHLSLNIYH